MFILVLVACCSEYQLYRVYIVLDHITFALMSHYDKTAQDTPYIIYIYGEQINKIKTLYELCYIYNIYIFFGSTLRVTPLFLWVYYVILALFRRYKCLNSLIGSDKGIFSGPPIRTLFP